MLGLNQTIEFSAVLYTDGKLEKDDYVVDWSDNTYPQHKLEVSRARGTERHHGNGLSEAKLKAKKIGNHTKAPNVPAIELSLSPMSQQNRAFFVLLFISFLLC